MYKILHIMGSADIGGISGVVLTWYKNIDRTKFHFDLLLTSTEIGRDGQAFQSMGSTVYRLPRKSVDLNGFVSGLTKILTDNKYDAIHVHYNETSYVALKVAKKLGVKCRIAHSHSKAPVYSIVDEMKRLSGIFLNPYYATQVIGCGKLAGNRIFGKMTMKRKMAHVLKNAIDCKLYAFSAETRDIVRNELGVQEKLVIGMVGRLSEEKNPSFAVKLISKLREINSNAYLVLVGDGDQKNNIEKEIQKNRVEESVIMLGSRNDVQRIYQALDILIMPSLYEGFPVVSVEAMSSGLPLLLSNNITDELSFYSKTSYCSLDNVDVWVDKIEEISKTKIDRSIGLNEVISNGFDICDVVKQLENIYLHDLRQ